MVSVSARQEDQTARRRKRLVGKTNDITVSDAIERYARPNTFTKKIQLLRPFAVFSAKAYSSPIVLPIGPAYIAGLLEAAGYDVDVIDGIISGLDNVEPATDPDLRRQGLSPDDTVRRVCRDTAVLGVSCMFTQEWIEHRELIKSIRREFPDLIIVVGGEHVTALPEYSLRDCPAIDFIITGEGEISFLELVHTVASGGDPRECDCVSFIDEDGNFVDRGLGLRIADFDNLPRPAWHLCSVENSFTGRFTQGISMGRNMPMLASRGCPYQCTFCSNPAMWTTRYMLRKPERVVDEIEWLISTYNVDSIDFADLTAIVKKEWTLRFCDELKRRKIKATWQLPSGTRSEALDEETLRAIYETGCKYLVYAPESGSPETLKMIKKILDLNRLKASVSSAVAIGHTVKINLIVGFPDETRKSMWQTLSFCVSMAFKGVTDCNVAIFSPYPGSELYEDLRRKNVIPKVDDRYIKGLLVQYDFTANECFCENVPSWEVKAYRILSMSLFYIISYIVRPTRLFRLLSVIGKSKFQPQSLFEQRIFDFIGRSGS